ncbi:MAG: serine/threonine protein kinase [Deltaproteobacteria bacterium]|nr:serine/threonine protein kinase [Deltaproteobacteria bacterium]
MERRIATGTWAHVYRAHDCVEGRTVALKVLRDDRSCDADVAGRFLEEGRLCARLAHPNVARVLGRGWTPDERPFLVLAYIDGPSLEELMRKEVRLPWPRVVRLAAQALGALAHIHDRGIIHRDITASNLIVERIDAQTERAVLVDFGFAQPAELFRAPAGVAMGPPTHMAPELWLGRGGDERSDLYALGCVLYAALTGRLPFATPEAGEPWVTQCMTSHLRERVPPVDALCDAVPADLANLVMALLEKDRVRRPQSARSALRRLSWVV